MRRKWRVKSTIDKDAMLLSGYQVSGGEATIRIACLVR